MSKYLIDRNWLKKFKHVRIDVKYIHTNFGGRNIFGFGDIATFKNCQISLSDHELYIIDVKYMQTNFGGCDILVFEILLPWTFPVSEILLREARKTGRER